MQHGGRLNWPSGKPYKPHERFNSEQNKSMYGAKISTKGKRALKVASDFKTPLNLIHLIVVADGVAEIHMNDVIAGV